MKKLFYGILIIFIFALFLFGVVYVGIQPDKQEKLITTVFTVREAYPCKYENAKWSRSDVFKSSENVYICVNISTNKPEDVKHLTIEAYTLDGNMRNQVLVYEKYQSFSVYDRYIPIWYEFDPGKYYISVIYGRGSLFEISIEVVK